MALPGEPDKTRAYYQQALEAAGRISFRPEIAFTHLQLAELLLDQPGGLSPPPSPLPQGEREPPSPPSMGEDKGGGDKAHERMHCARRPWSTWTSPSPSSGR